MDNAPVFGRSPARRRTARRGRLWDWLLVLLMLGALALAGGAAALLYGERGFLARIYPHVAVRGTGLGGMHIDTARGALAQRYAAFLNNPVELQLGERRWYPSAADLGLHLEIDEAVAAAHALGRESSRADNIRRVLAVWRAGADLPLRAVVDQAAIQRYLLAVARAVEAPPRNADLRLEGMAIIVTPEAFGTQVLVDETLADITAALQGLEPQAITLRTREIPPLVRDADIAPVAAELHGMLARPLSLVAADGRRWSWGPDRIAAWLSLRPAEGAGGAPYRVVIDQGAIRRDLLPVAAAVRQEGGLPRVEWGGGSLRILEEGTPGLGLDAEAALALVNGALLGGEAAISLPMGAIPPPVTQANLGSLGIVAPVGVGVSSFARSEQYRITNIQAGARRMHGVLLPPGGSFSFNEHLGAVDAANGFVEGLAIVDNRTQKEWGGGLCQVSTTVFRAAFWGGLPIEERHEHSFRIGWYEELGEPPGLDAAIFTPFQDMRFTNDTGGWLLVQTGVDLRRQRLTVTLYGAPSQREVSMSHAVLEETPAPTEPVYVDDPEQPVGYERRSDIARGGIKVEVYRVVREGGAVIMRDTFPTEFKPWPDIFVRGTGPAGS